MISFIYINHGVVSQLNCDVSFAEVMRHNILDYEPLSQCFFALAQISILFFEKFTPIDTPTLLASVRNTNSNTNSSRAQETVPEF